MTNPPIVRRRVPDPGNRAARTGRQLVYIIWQRSDSPEAFYACSDVTFGGSTPTPTTTPTSTPDHHPDPRPRRPRTAPGCTAPEWSNSAVYAGGNQVSYAGHTWQAKWWTTGETPGTTGEWGVWKDLGRLRSDHHRHPDHHSDHHADHGHADHDPDHWNAHDQPARAARKVVGYFPEWGTYGRTSTCATSQASGAAAKLTHLYYAFGNVTGGQCADRRLLRRLRQGVHRRRQRRRRRRHLGRRALRGNFNQLRKLKKLNPNLKVIWSFGGWTWSGGFGQAAANPTAFAQSCRALVEDPRWADVFDGIDIDWEYPNACGLSCDTSGAAAYKNLMAALRTSFGSDLVTSAITADGTAGGKMDKADYGGAAASVDWFMPMTYDFFGTWDAQGPTAPHSPLNSYPGIPIQGFDSDTAIQHLKSKGVPSNKILLGIGFYGRGWTGVTQAAPGGTATGAAPGTYEAGQRGLQGAEDQVSGHRHRRRHGVRLLQRAVVELRHPEHHRGEDVVRQEPGAGRCLLLGPER